LKAHWEKKRRVMNHYDTTAYLYDLQYSEEQKLKIKFSLNNLNLKLEFFLLDVGCGTGLLFDYVSESVNVLVGVDISRGILGKAKEKIKGKKNVFLVQADADYLPFQDGIFDAVFAITLLQNIPSPIKTLKEISRVAKNHAAIIITGLKKKFNPKNFEQLLSTIFLLERFWDRRELNDYIALLSKRF